MEPIPARNCTPEILIPTEAGTVSGTRLELQTAHKRRNIQVPLCLFTWLGAGPCPLLVDMFIYGHWAADSIPEI